MRWSCSVGEWIPAFVQHLRHAIIMPPRCMSAMASVPKSASVRAFSAICDRLGIGDRLAVRNDALAAIGGRHLPIAISPFPTRMCSDAIFR